MSVTVAWLALITAGLLDVAWAVSMKYAEGYTRLGWTLESLVSCWPPLSSCSGAV